MVHGLAALCKLKNFGDFSFFLLSQNTYINSNKAVSSSFYEFFFRYAWASPCRRANLAKTVWMSDTVLNIQGRFVLVYVSAKNSIFGMSDPFDVIPG